MCKKGTNIRQIGYGTWRANNGILRKGIKISTGKKYTGEEEGFRTKYRPLFFSKKPEFNSFMIRYDTFLILIRKKGIKLFDKQVG
jgi:hypothetical protein